MANLNCVVWEKSFIRSCSSNNSNRFNQKGTRYNSKIFEKWPRRDSNREPIGERHASNRVKMQVVAATEGSAKSKPAAEEKIPAWARPDSDETPPWARNEGKGQSAGTDQGFQIPFFVYLLSSAIVAIAAVGSVFEYVNRNPVFGVVTPDSVFYAPLLGFFAFTGLPFSAFLWFKSIQAANKAAEEQDRQDGY